MLLCRTITDYKAELIKHVKGMLVSTEYRYDSVRQGHDRACNPVSISNKAMTAEYKLSVATQSGKNYYGLAKVIDTTGETAAGSFAALNPGLTNIPVGLPVVLRAATSSGYAWAVTTAPTGSAPTLVDDGTQLAVFTPFVPGQYIVSQSTGTVSSFTIFAGTWRGVITGEDANGRPVPDANCTACHNGSIAPDKFTPWKNSGHSEIFKQNLNAGGHYSEACFPCHTVGYNKAANNNGFDDQPGFASFVTTSFYFGTKADNSRYRRFMSDFPEMGQRTNVQCENCHGPQEMGAGVDSLAHHNTSTTSRTSMSSDVCGICHGEPQRHARFQQWESSGHANFELAVEEGTSANCMGCHSAQGFLIYLDQLEAGNPLRTIVTSSLTGTWTTSTVQPQTCTVCHDPHAQGTTSGEPNTATVRVVENTRKLPGGFAATGVGRGAICIVCHNSRNGGSGTNSFLHQDGDSVFGRLTSYAAPHASCQGDVLLGYNAYFVGSGSYRSPHSIIADTCATCHMEVTPPPALLSYNLAGTNHTFRASINICSECHSVNVALGPMYQLKVKSSVEALKESIQAKIISRNTGTPLQSVELIESHGQPAIDALFTNGSRAEVTLNTLPGIRIADLGTDALAKAIWNLLLIENDQSFGIHNPDFTFAVLGGAQYNVDTIPDSVVPSDEL